MTYFTADLHLGHTNILRMAERPFSCIEEMDETLIANWNERVKGNDTVYIVGDLIFKSKTNNPEQYLSRLKGKKILVLGNHDHDWKDKVDMGRYFKEVLNLKEVDIEGHLTTICHYPMIEWRSSRKENSKRLGFLIHGHIHKNTEKPEYMQLFRLPNALNAGVDINGFRPVTFEELLKNNSAFKHDILKGTADEELLSEREENLKKWL